MFKIKVISTFNAAHRLRAYKGKCERLHGHNWKVKAVVCSQTLDKLGMVMDFKILKKRLDTVLAYLDHGYLNDKKEFKKTNPTSENIAKFIFDKLSKNVKDLRSISVWETDTSCATYTKD